MRAQVAIKIFGNDLADLRSSAAQLKEMVSNIPGVVDLQIEKQVLVPQLIIKIDRQAVKRYGLQVGKVAEYIEIFYNGKVSSQILDGQKSFDILLRTTDSARQDLDAIGNTQISLPNGALIPLQQIAKIELENGINTIYHENTLRRIVISCNVQGRDLGATVKEMQQKVNANLKLPQGYFLQWGGQFESQQSASKLILILSIFSFAGIYFVLYSPLYYITPRLKFYLITYIVYIT